MKRKFSVKTRNIAAIEAAQIENLAYKVAKGDYACFECGAKVGRCFGIVKSDKLYCSRCAGVCEFCGHPKDGSPKRAYNSCC